VSGFWCLAFLVIGIFGVWCLVFDDFGVLCLLLVIGVLVFLVLSVWCF
jgi:hypothetical protein